jgi:hypothetical protein
MRFKGLRALGLSALAIGLLPGSALAAKPATTTGGASNVTFNSVRVNGSVDANKAATNYYFQYGTSKAYGTNTPQFPAGARANAIHVSTDIGSLAPATRYHYRIVAVNASGTALGKDRTFTTRRQPLGVSLSASPNPVPFGKPTVLAGTLSGTGNAGRTVVLQSNPWPYTQGFKDAANQQVTDASGNFSFPLLSVPFNTQYQVRLPDRPTIASPIGTVGVKQYVKTHVSKHKVQRGHRVRFSGTVNPQGSAQQIAFQKKRSGKWITIAGTDVHSGGKYAKNVKVNKGGSFRVWTGVSDQQYASNHGKTVHLRTFR